MGTNYYLHKKPPCEACGHEPAPLHIGKSSGGWCFSLHVIPEIALTGVIEVIPCSAEAEASINEQ